MRWLRNLFSRSDREAPPPALAAAQPVAATSPEGTDWEAHQRAGEAGPVAIAVDLSLERRAPVADRPRLVRVRCALRAPRPDGLPGGPELEALARLEDLLCGALAPLGAVYAGRVSMAGAREHLFYLPDAAPVTEAVDGVRAAVAEHDLEVAGEDDPTWRAYREELFPTPRAHRWLLDRRAVEALGRRGDRSGSARPVDHQASFPTAEAREAFAAEAAAQGFEVVARRDDGPPPNGYGVDLRRDDPVDLRHVNGVAWTLCELASRCGGAYDGWEAPVEPGQGAARA